MDLIKTLEKSRSHLLHYLYRSDSKPIEFLVGSKFSNKVKAIKVKETTIREKSEQTQNDRSQHASTDKQTDSLLDFRSEWNMSNTNNDVEPSELNQKSILEANDHHIQFSNDISIMI